MSRVKTLALAVVVLFALTGCAPLFEFNLFGALDTPPTPTLADYTDAGGLDALGEDLNSPATVEALAANPSLVQEIEDYLWDTYIGDGGGVENEEDSQAAILYADLALKTSEGENLVNNVVEALLDGTLGSSSNIGTLLAAIIPPEALASEAIFTDMVEALLAANDAYEQLGIYVDFDGDGHLTNQLPPGSAPGDVVQKSIVAYTMYAMVDAVVTGLPTTESDAIVQLFLVATNATTDPRYDTDMGTLTVEPMASPPPWLQALMELAPLP
ncbi:MAG: hypothetical protein A2177_15815 [Spirochaetes bacterium RBG_13_68_11]|nr:MAG: hypothetical protein A2177_15815 [Spirochaetes bacterium RBG_13_68_11]